MIRVLFFILSLLIVVIYFLTTKEQSKIEDKMKIEAKIIAQSSKIFLSNLAFDELQNKIKLDMQLRNIRAIEIKDFLLDENIIVAYKDKNDKINFVKKLPLNYQKYSQIKENIIEKKSYATNKLGELTLYYDSDLDTNIINRYTKLNFSKEEQNYLDNKEYLTMCIDPHWMPFEEIKNNEHTGITSDYADIFRQLIGIPINLLVTSTWNESLLKAENRECDIFTLASKTRDRERYMDFTTPYINNPIVIATKVGIPFIESLDQIKDKKIAVVRGYSLYEQLRKDYPTLDIFEVDSLYEGLKAVEENKIFAYLDNSTVINHAIQKNFLGSVTISGKIKYSFDFSVATRNDEPLLNTIFETVIWSIDDHTKEKIFNKWIKINYNIKTDYTLVFQLLFVSLLIIFGTIYWNRKLSILNKQLSVERDKAKKLTETKSEFLANMSHEIRTPMNGIIGMSHLALESNLDEKSKNYILKIDKSAKSLLNIINDILDFSKLEAGKLTIEKVEFNLNEVIANIINLSEIKINEKELKLIVDFDSSENQIFYGDPHRLTQIITNLMGNAIKFTKFGSVTLRIQKHSNNIVRFSIEDTGIGLSVDQIDKLFQSFSQADTSITRKYGGTGLGLSISKQLVELLNGKIWVESQEGRGSTFSFELELPQIHTFIEKKDEKNLQDFHKIEQFLTNGSSWKILLVEDNLINQEIIKGLLENTNITIEIAQNGLESIEMIKQFPTKYHLIIMDIKMPVMNGDEASKVLREMSINIPIIALTANIITDNDELLSSQVIDDYLHKPIDIEKLYQLLYKYLSNELITAKSELVTTYKYLDDLSFLDVPSALKRLSDNKDLYLKILKDFKDSYKNLDLQSLNEEDFKLTIHTLKGLSGNIGANKLFEIVNIIDESGDKSLIDNLYERLDEVLNELSFLDIKEDSNISKQLITDEIRNKLFEELRLSVQNKRPKNVTLAISNIEKYKLNQKDEDNFNRIKKFLNAYKYRDALSLL